MTLKKKISEKARRARRNAIQQAWRARPGGREYEARASRVSYWRKRMFYDPTCICDVCAALRRQHKLAAPPAPIDFGCGCNEAWGG